MEGYLIGKAYAGCAWNGFNGSGQVFHVLNLGFGSFVGLFVNGQFKRHQVVWIEAGRDGADPPQFSDSDGSNGKQCECQKAN